jgi:hypothetical protein
MYGASQRLRESNRRAAPVCALLGANITRAAPHFQSRQDRAQRGPSGEYAVRFSLKFSAPPPVRTRRPFCPFESVNLERAMPFEAALGLHTKVLRPVSEQSYRHLDGTCAPRGMARSPHRRRHSHFWQNRSFGVAALPRRLHAAQFNVVGKGEAGEAHYASQVWWNRGGRLR